MYYETDENGDEVRLGAISEVAAELGVAVNQVSMWYHRHERNGFPAPVKYLKARNGVLAAHFDVDAVKVWRLYYVPAKGGYAAHRARAAGVGSVVRPPGIEPGPPL